MLRFVVAMIAADRTMLGSSMPFSIGDGEPAKGVAAASLKADHAASINSRCKHQFRTRRQSVSDKIMNKTREVGMSSRLNLIIGLAAAALALASGAITDARAQALEKLTIVIFSPPSLGALLPPVIKAQKFDQANGLDITFEERPPDAYVTQFNSGEFKVGGSASLTTLGLADVRGVKVRYLLNLFDYWGTIVTSRDTVKTLKDLEGKELAGARSTTNYQMYEFFTKKQGVDVSKIKVVNTAPPGLISYAIADRADAIQIWEPAYTLMITKKSSIRTIDLNIAKTWKDSAGGGTIPYLGVGAHADWADANPATVQKLYTIYKAAVEWVQKNPDEAAPLLAKGAPPEELKAVAAMIRSNERLAMKLTAANDIKKDIEAVYKAGMEINYLPSMPSPASIYDKPLK